MKRYINMSALIVFASSSFVVALPLISPTTPGDDAIVNAIKQYSNLTEADVNQYKLLILGSLDTVGAFIAGAVSTIGTGVGLYQQSGAIQDIAPERVPSWMTSSLILAGLGSASAGLVSYKVLYPRIRAGVLDKVQRFINVCQALHEDSPVDDKKKKLSIVSHPFPNFFELQNYLPEGWPRRGNVAVRNALDNLVQQASLAELLLNQIGQNDDEINQKRTLIKQYGDVLSANLGLYETVITEDNRIKSQSINMDKQAIMKEKRAALKNADLEANVGLKQAGTSLANAKVIQTYGEMFADSIKNIRDGLNYLYKNKEKIAYRGSILSAAAYGGYSYLKNKLGYAQ